MLKASSGNSVVPASLGKWAGVFFAAALAGLVTLGLPDAAVAQQSPQKIVKCLQHFNLLEKKETKKDNQQDDKFAIQVISGSLNPLDNYKNIMGLGCYVFDQAFVQEMADKAIAVDIRKISSFKVLSGPASGVLREPGLLGLGGAEGFLTEMLVTEVMGLWVLAVKHGARVPVPTEKEIELYVDIHLDEAKKNPDAAGALRLRAWDYLVDVILSTDKPSSEAQKFISSVQGYIKKEQVRLASEAQKKYADYKAEKDRKITHMGALFHTGHAPYDPLHEMKTALAMSARTGGYLAGMLGSKALMDAARRKVLKEISIKMAAMDDEADDVAKWIAGEVRKGKARTANLGAGRHRVTRAGGSARKAITRAMGRAAKLPAKAASKVAGRAAVAVAKVAGMLGRKAIIAVPAIGIIIDSVVTLAENLPKLAKNAAIEKRLKGAVDAAKNADWNLGKMFKTRQGTEMVALYFAKATGGDSPARVDIPVPACRACFFAEKNFKGEHFCTGGRVSDLRNFDDGTAIRKFNNKIRSVQMFADKTCKAPSVILHENQRHTGHKVVLHTSAPDLSRVRRGKRAHWDKQASSVAYRDKAAPRCEVCLYTKKNHKGSQVCVAGGEPDLSALGVNNQVSSIRLYNKACKAAKYWAYDRKKFTLDKKGRGYLASAGSPGYVGSKWNNRISSVYFSPEGANPLLEKAKGGCRVCLYDITGQKGNYVCLNAGENQPDLNNVKSGADTIKFRNKASSVQFITDHCRPGDQLTLELFGQARYKGSREVHIRDANLKRFNNGASSVKVSLKSKENVNKLCRVCLYSGVNYQGDRRCFTGNANTKKLGFNNKARSIKFEINACKKTAGAVFYENDMKGHEFYSHVSIGDLGKKRRGKKANWSKQISALKFNKNLRRNREAATKNNKAAAKKCQVCLYADANYRGAKTCSGPASVPDLKKVGLRDKVSSVKISGNSCSRAKLMIYEDPNYKSYNRLITKSIASLKNLKMRKGGRKTFDNDMASFKFTN